MDHAITDSHATVTISHNVIKRHSPLKERNTDLSAHVWVESQHCTLWGV